MRTSTRRFTRCLVLPGLAGAALATAWSMAGPPPPVDVVKEPTKMPASAKEAGQPAGPLDFTVKDIDGKEQKLSDYRGKVVMIVNVASRCGFTKQYTGLEELYRKYADRGFVILGFPANNFGGQEPGSDEQIKQFCTGTYNVTFPMMSKISVLGDDKAPLYRFLTEKGTAGDFAGDVTWNFNKYLIDRNGNVIARYASQTKPQDAKVTAEVEKALDAKPAAAAGHGEAGTASAKAGDKK